MKLAPFLCLLWMAVDPVRHFARLDILSFSSEHGMLKSTDFGSYELKQICDFQNSFRSGPVKEEKENKFLNLYC
ncbi:hypothetical protein Peur_005554 [Populus x canadensis]